MIGPGATFEVKLLPLSALHVTEYQERYPERLQHYIEKLRNAPGWAPGVILVQPMGATCGYEILDGHHRFAAHIITGRSHALCLIVYGGDTTSKETCIEERRERA
jgi:hypothetical protein